MELAIKVEEDTEIRTFFLGHADALLQREWENRDYEAVIRQWQEELLKVESLRPWGGGLVKLESKGLNSPLTRKERRPKGCQTVVNFVSAVSRETRGRTGALTVNIMKTEVVAISPLLLR